MLKRVGVVVLFAALSTWISLTLTPGAKAQQTLGGITGTVADKTGSVLPDTAVTIVGDQTQAHPQL
jgi:hypothetical protein